jgi:hypothetical protein
MNFWASANAQIDHCRIYFREVHGREKQKVEYNGFVDRLCASDWAFGFFQDLRDLALHHTITFPDFHKHVTDRSIALTISLNTAALRSFKHRWKRYRLPAEDESLDLIKLTSLYYMRLRDDFHAFLRKWFVPHLAPAHEFFANLAKEVAAVGPGYSICVITDLKSDGTSTSFTAKYPPINLLAELGLKEAPQPVLGAPMPRLTGP